MAQTYTAVVKNEDEWWIGWIEEVPGVNCQEPTRDALLETLRVTLTEARSAAGSEFEELQIEAARQA